MGSFFGFARTPACGDVQQAIPGMASGGESALPELLWSFQVVIFKRRGGSERL